VEKSIIIDEAIHIAKEFDSDDSFRFINAVLDKIANEAKNES
ncbi:MAG: N utilization substance protein B, partial [Treponema sp.]|nr:N utilization substance protein B [Treponema sp.]